MTSQIPQIDAFEKANFTAPMGDQDRSFDVYRRGEGAPVVLMQELPGIGQETLLLADKLVEAGFQVVMPHLFGPIGRTSSIGNMTRVFCMRREFSLFSKGETSPIVAWLAALCRLEKDRMGAKGVGVIGMCLTGNFAISLMADDAVLAGVASQPAMPFNSQTALHMSETDVAQISAKLDDVGPMHAYRFDGDALCTATKFDAIGSAFNADRERIKLTTLPGPGHSVFTRHFVDEEGHPTSEALKSVISYFKGQLT